VTADPLDMLVMSDVVYDPQFYEPLVASLANLVTSGDIVCIMAHRHRHPEDHKFFDLLQRAGFDAVDISHEPSEALLHACQDVRLLRIERRATGN
jgi:predicted nicotinamide N-methyase